MTKILCIDDTPDEILTTEQSLRETIERIFEDNPDYKVIFKKSGNEGIKSATEDAEIKLVLLDVEFNKKIEGPSIADELQEKVPHIKVIVLTRVDDRGKKISFGWKPNIVHYVLKRELSNPSVLYKLKNLSIAVIEDYENKNWELEYSASCTINLTHKSRGVTFGINIPSMTEGPLMECMKSPNKPVSWVGNLSTADLNKVHNIVNTNVLEATDWNTWGILSRDKCAKGQLKLIIGSVSTVSPSTPRTSEDSYVIQSQFERLKEEFDNFKREVLDRLEEFTLKKRIV